VRREAHGELEDGDLGRMTGRRRVAALEAPLAAG